MKKKAMFYHLLCSFFFSGMINELNGQVLLPKTFSPPSSTQKQDTNTINDQTSTSKDAANEDSDEEDDDDEDSNEVSEVLDFWFGQLPDPNYLPEDKLSLWFSGTQEIDRQVKEKFSDMMIKAANGDYNDWLETPRGRLALILLLDQFPRHVFRNQPQAFMTDSMARILVLDGIKKGDDQSLYPIERAFFYLPLEHTENLDMQNLSVSLYQKLFANSPPALKNLTSEFLRYAILHRQIIERFGRFPHRNTIFGRKSTPEELVYMGMFRKF